MDDRSAALTYADYLALDEVLDAQRPRSLEHDELLFIVVHQVYELWFKQILHELAELQRSLEHGEASHAGRTLRRILKILKVVVAQIDVLETMTPLQFLGFRARLDAASGFQSAQFRELEAVLGRRDPAMADAFGEAGAAVTDAMDRPALFDSFLRFLSGCGYEIPAEHLDRTPQVQWEPDRRVQDVLVQVHRDDADAAAIAELLVDLDEGLQEWRYRHTKMVERTIGSKGGTGGSAGAAYLRSTLFRPAFPDLWAIRSEL